MKHIAIVGIVWVSTLTACGGGGGGTTSPPPAPVTVFPVDSVVKKLATVGGSFKGTNTNSQGVATKLTVTYVPGASGFFSRNQTLTTNGIDATTSNAIGFVGGGSNFTVTSWTDTTGNRAVIGVGDSTALPSTANVGTTGKMFTASSFSVAVPGHGASYAWTLTAASDTTADLCLVAWDLGEFYSSWATDCFRIDSTGTISAFKSTLGYHAKGIDGQTDYQ